ncbi:MAG: hypothetical protein GY795_42625 [Desulfobacterales bacterium]|nr:hypothetical protein [Desulfobacterales bacterium]
MNKRKLQIFLGIYLILSHFGVILLIFILFIPMNEFSQLTTTLGLIVPMFSVYTTAIIRFIIKNMEHTELPDKTVSRMFVFLSFFLPTVFIIYLSSIIIMKAYNYAFSDFDNFKIVIGLSETFFGVYVGQIIVSLYDESINEKKTDGKPKN